MTTEFPAGLALAQRAALKTCVPPQLCLNVVLAGVLGVETKLHVSTGGGPGLAGPVGPTVCRCPPVPTTGTGTTIAPVAQSGKFLADFSVYAVGVHTQTVVETGLKRAVVGGLM